MDDYAKARYKSNKRLTVLKMTTSDGGMNPDMSSVDFIQDGDLNKSLKHYVCFNFPIVLIYNKIYVFISMLQCLEILEDHEEPVLDLLRKDVISSNIDVHVCTDAAKYCDDVIPEDDYVHEEL